MRSAISSLASNQLGGLCWEQLSLPAQLHLKHCGIAVAAVANAGVAGLVWSYHSNCTAAELRAAISASAVDAGARGRDDLYGFGIVNAVAAHNYLLQHPCESCLQLE